MKNEYTEDGNKPLGDKYESAEQFDKRMKKHAPKVEKILDEMFKTRRNNAEDQEERSLKLEKMRLIKKYFGWKNEDIARQLKTTPQTIKSRLSPSSKQNLPIWVDAFILMFESLKPGTLARIQAAEDRNKPTIIIDESQFLQQ